MTVSPELLGRTARVLYRLRMLQAAKREIITRDDGKKGYWITVNGAKVFVEDGQSEKDAIDKKFGKPEKKDTDKKSNKGKYDKYIIRDALDGEIWAERTAETLVEAYEEEITKGIEADKDNETILKDVFDTKELYKKHKDMEKYLLESIQYAKTKRDKIIKEMEFGKKAKENQPEKEFEEKAISKMDKIDYLLTPDEGSYFLGTDGELYKIKDSETYDTHMTQLKEFFGDEYWKLHENSDDHYVGFFEKSGMARIHYYDGKFVIGVRAPLSNSQKSALKDMTLHIKSSDVEVHVERKDLTKEQQKRQRRSLASYLGVKAFNASRLSARALKVLYQLKALRAVKDKHGREGKWITVKGTPVFIENGQDVGDAIKEKFSDNDLKWQPADKFNPDDWDLGEYQDIVKDDVAIQKRLSSKNHILKNLNALYNEAVEDFSDPDWLADNLDKINETFGKTWTMDDVRKYTSKKTGNVFVQHAWAAMRHGGGLDELAPGKWKTYVKKRKQLQQSLNRLYHARLAQTNFLYRGTSRRELDSLKKHRVIGKGGGTYNFVSLSVNPHAADKFVSKTSSGKPGIILAFPKQDLKDHLVSQGYGVESVGDSHNIGDFQGRQFIWEEEHRLPDEKIHLDDVGLTIHAELAHGESEKSFREKYGELGNIVFRKRSLALKASDSETEIISNILKLYDGNVNNTKSSVLRFMPDMTEEKFDKLIKKLKPLNAKREIITRDDGKRGYWITVKGAKVFVEEGESEGEAIEKAFGGGDKKGKWITANDAKIFVEDQQYEEDAIKKHFSDDIYKDGVVRTNHSGERQLLIDTESLPQNAKEILNNIFFNKNKKWGMFTFSNRPPKIHVDDDGPPSADNDDYSVKENYEKMDYILNLPGKTIKEKLTKLIEEKGRPSDWQTKMIDTLKGPWTVVPVSGIPDRIEIKFPHRYKARKLNKLKELIYKNNLQWENYEHDNWGAAWRNVFNEHEYANPEEAKQRVGTLTVSRKKNLNARALKILYQLKALHAAGFDPNQPRDKSTGRWSKTGGGSNNSIKNFEKSLKNKYGDQVKDYDRKKMTMFPSERNEWYDYFGKAQFGGAFYTHPDRNTILPLDITEEDLKSFGVFEEDDHISPDKRFLYAMSQLILTPYDRNNLTDYHKFNQMWDFVVNKNPKLQKKMNEYHAATNLVNEEYRKRYDSQPYFSRGTTLEELDNYLEFGEFGAVDADEERKYEYTAMSLSNHLTAFWGPVQITYHADKLREDTELVNYTLKSQPMGISKSIRSGNREDLKLPMDVAFHTEAEVRMPDGVSIYDNQGKSKIKKITFRDLGEFLDDAGRQLTHAQRVDNLKSQYGDLAEELKFIEDGNSADAKKHQFVKASLTAKTTTGKIRVGLDYYSSIDEAVKKIMKSDNLPEHVVRDEIGRLYSVSFKDKKSKSLNAKREIITRKDGKRGYWITVNSAKVFVEEGKDEVDAVEKAFGKNQPKYSIPTEYTNKYVPMRMEERDWKRGNRLAQKIIDLDVKRGLFSDDVRINKTIFAERSGIQKTLVAARDVIRKLIAGEGDPTKWQFANPFAIYKEADSSVVTTSSNTSYDQEMYNNDRALVMMNPQRFLDLAAELPESQKKQKTIASLTEKMKKATPIDTPQLDIRELNIQKHDGEVWQHEGRHRALAAIEAGIKEIPVFIKNQSGKLTDEERQYLVDGGRLRNQDDTKHAALQAKREIITRDDGKKGYWITVKGSKVFVEEGQSKEEAIKEAFGDKNENVDVTNILDEYDISLDPDLYAQDLQNYKGFFNDVSIIQNEYEDTIENLANELDEKFPNLKSLNGQSASELFEDGESLISPEMVSDYKKAVKFTRSKLSKEALQKEKEVTAIHRALLDENKVLFRGTDIAELTRKRRKTRYGEKHNFISTSLSPNMAHYFPYAGSESDVPIVIQYDMNDTKEGKDYEFVKYRAQPFIHVETAEREYKPFEEFGGYHSIGNANEMEVHLPENHKTPVTRIYVKRGLEEKAKKQTPDTFIVAYDSPDEITDMANHTNEELLEYRPASVVSEGSKPLTATKFQPQKGEEPDKDGNYWRTIRGRKIPFQEGQEVEHIIGKPPAYPDISRKVRETLKTNKDKQGYSYNPRTGNVFDATNPHQAEKFFDEVMRFNPDFDDSKPVYVVGVTNHEGRQGRRLHSAYSTVTGKSNMPLFGFWTGDGFDYLDVAYPIQVSEEKAKQTGEHYAQEAVLKIWPNGEHKFVSTAKATPLQAVHAKMLMYKLRALKASGELVVNKKTGKKGYWITVKKTPIFVEEGQRVTEAIQKKFYNQKSKMTKDGFRQLPGQKVTVRKTVPKHWLPTIATAWNGIPKWRRKNVKRLYITDAESSFGGTANQVTREVKLYARNISNHVKDTTSLLEHELGHMYEYTLSFEQKKEWNERTKHIGPITNYAGLYKKPDFSRRKHAKLTRLFTKEVIDAVNEGTPYEETRGPRSKLFKHWNITEEDVKSGKLNEIVDEFIEVSVNRYQTEQFAEFSDWYITGNEKKGFNKENAEKLKEVYESMGLHKKSLNARAARILYQLKALQASEGNLVIDKKTGKKGYWITVKGSKVFVEEGQRVTEAIKQKFQNPEAKITKDGFRELPGQKITVRKSVPPTWASSISIAWNAVPEWRRKLVKKLYVTSAESRSGGSMNQANRKMILYARNIDVNNIKSIGSLIEHELGHAYEYTLTLDQMREWNERTKHIGPITDYSGSYRTNEIKKESEEYVESHRKRVQSIIDQVNDGVPYDEDLAYDFSSLFKQWGAGEEDIKSGKVRKLMDEFSEVQGNLYQTEQFAEFSSWYIDGIEEKGFNQANAEKLKEVYEDMGLHKKSLNAAIDKYGNKGEWKTIKGTRVFIPVGKTTKEVLAEKFGPITDTKTKFQYNPNQNFSNPQELNYEMVSQFSDAWNKAPKAKRDLIKNITVKLHPKGLVGGGYEMGSESITFWVSSQVSPAMALKYVEHELAHADFARLSLETIIEWNLKTANIGPISKNAQKHLLGYKEVEYYQTATNILAGARNIDETHKSGKHIKLADQYYPMLKTIEKWGLTDDDVRAGKLLKLAEKYHEQFMHSYQTEQFADLVAHMAGGELENFNQENYEKLKAVYDEMGLGKKALAARAMKILYQLKALKAYDESKHCRLPSGRPGGGQWVQCDIVGGEKPTKLLKMRPTDSDEYQFPYYPSLGHTKSAERFFRKKLEEAGLPDHIPDFETWEEGAKWYNAQGKMYRATGEAWMVHLHLENMRKAEQNSPEAQAHNKLIHEEIKKAGQKIGDMVSYARPGSFLNHALVVGVIKEKDGKPYVQGKYEIHSQGDTVLGKRKIRKKFDWHRGFLKHDGSLDAAVAPDRWITVQNGQPVPIFDNLGVKESIKKHFDRKRTIRGSEALPETIKGKIRNEIKYLDNLKNRLWYFDEKDKVNEEGRKVTHGIHISEKVTTHMQGPRWRPGASEINPENDEKMNEFLAEMRRYSGDVRRVDESEVEYAKKLAKDLYENPDPNVFPEVQDIIKKYDNMVDRVLQEYKTVWRSTDWQNIRNVIKTGKLGEGRKHPLRDPSFVSTTVDPDYVVDVLRGKYEGNSQPFKIEFDTSDWVRGEDYEPIKHYFGPTFIFYPGDDDSVDFVKAKNVMEKMGEPSGVDGLWESEVRVRTGAPAKIRQILIPRGMDQQKEAYIRKELKKHNIKVGYDKSLNPKDANEMPIRGFKKATPLQAVRAEMLMYHLKALQAAKREIITRNDGKRGYWITVKGAKVFVEEGQTEEEAVKEAFGDKEKSESLIVRDADGKIDAEKTEEAILTKHADFIEKRIKEKSQAHFILEDILGEKVRDEFRDEDKEAYDLVDETLSVMVQTAREEKLSKEREEERKKEKEEKEEERAIARADDPKNHKAKMDKIWDVADRITAEQKEALIETWNEIPLNHLRGLKSVKINSIHESVKEHGNGFYDGNMNVSVDVSQAYDGLGMKALLKHEINHYVWHVIRTDKEIQEWQRGVARIRAKTGKSPTEYVESFLSGIYVNRLKDHKEHMSELRRALDNDDITAHHFFGEIYEETRYQAGSLKHKLREAEEKGYKKRSSKFREELKPIQEYLNKLNQQFADATDAERKAKVQENLDDYTVSSYEEVNEKFYNEAHSAVGAYIAEREDQLAFRRATSTATNEDVMDEYVELYKKVFKD